MLNISFAAKKLKSQNAAEFFILGMETKFLKTFYFYVNISVNSTPILLSLSFPLLSLSSQQWMCGWINFQFQHVFFLSSRIVWEELFFGVFSSFWLKKDALLAFSSLCACTLKACPFFFVLWLIKFHILPMALWKIFIWYFSSLKFSWKFMSETFAKIFFLFCDMKIKNKVWERKKCFKAYLTGGLENFVWVTLKIQTWLKL